MQRPTQSPSRRSPILTLAFLLAVGALAVPAVAADADAAVPATRGEEMRFFVGEPLPAFTAQAIGGPGTHSRDDLAGRHALVVVWATYCMACRGEIPYLDQVYDRYGDRLSILSLSLDDSAETVARFRAEEAPMPWRHGLLPAGPEVHGHPSWVFGPGLVWNIPKLMLVSPQGSILATGSALRGERMLANLAEVLGEAGAQHEVVARSGRER